MQVTMDKGPLLELLRENLTKAKVEDTRLKKSHEAEEQKVLAKFRDTLQAALKWDYKRAKKENFNAGPGYRSAPACPVANAPQIQRIIDQVKLAKASSHTFGADSDVGLAVYWKPEAERLKDSLCD